MSSAGEMLSGLRQENAGFTLIEILLVLTLVGLMMVIVPPLFSNSVPTLTLKGAARDFIIAVREARSRAITASKTQELHVYPEERRYLMKGVKEFETFPEHVSLELEGVIPIPDTETAGIIRFFADGSASGGLLTLTSGKFMYRVEVSWLTGKAAILPAGGTDG